MSKAIPTYKEFKNASLDAKYSPNTPEEYIYISEDMKTYTDKIMKDKQIQGHVLLYGHTGWGKSSFANMIRKYLVQSQVKDKRIVKDVVFITDYKVADIERLKGLMNSVSSTKTVVVFEEFERKNIITSTSFVASLKDLIGTAKFQEKVSIIATSNNIIGIDPAIIGRFVYKTEFTGKLTDYMIPQIVKRLQEIIKIEFGKEVESEEIKLWLENNRTGSMRDILNEVQKYEGIPTTTIDIEKQRTVNTRLIKSIKVVFEYLKTLSQQNLINLYEGKYVSNDIRTKYNSYIKLVHDVAFDKDSLPDIRYILSECMIDPDFSANAQITFLNIMKEQATRDMLDERYEILGIHNRLLKTLAYNTNY